LALVLALVPKPHMVALQQRVQELEPAAEKHIGGLVEFAVEAGLVALQVWELTVITSIDHQPS